MTNKTLAVAIGAALLLPTLAFAEVQVVNGEAGMIFKDAPSTITRDHVADWKGDHHAPVLPRGVPACRRSSGILLTLPLGQG